MKYLSIILVSLIFSSSTLGAMSPRYYETEILGNWVCKDLYPGYAAIEVIRYKDDGTWNSFGELIVDFPIEENKVKVKGINLIKKHFKEKFLTMDLGDVCIFDEHIIHKSNINKTNKIRFAGIVRQQAI